VILSRSPLFVPFFLLALLTAARIPAAAQSDPVADPAQKGSVAVTTERSWQTLGDVPATIQVHSLSHNVDVEATVENLTRVAFHNLLPDNYRVSVAVPGHEPVQMDLNLAAGQSSEVALVLDPDPPGYLILRRATGQEDAVSQPTDLTAANDQEATAASHSSNACQLDEVLHGVTLHLSEFVDNVNRYSATEILEYERLNKHGKLEEKAHRKSNYVATIQETRPGILGVDEYRNGSQGLSLFPGDIAAVGAPALALIFHPFHAKEFSMTCQGIIDWHGHSTWQIQFQQRLDQPATVSAFRVGNDSLPILLKGSAWIDSNNYQILHLETDLLQAIPEMKLNVEHQSLDYGPVQFSGRQVSLWLPQTAEITLEFKGKRFLERHLYSNFQLFSTDTGQKIGKPQTEPN
jgi:hypothetical protein